MFRSELNLTADPEPDFWLLGRPLIWSDSVYGTIMAPSGFRTDLASIPRVVRNLPFLDVDGQSRRPAVLHDYLYSSRTGFRLGRDFADRFLYTALLAEGTTKATAWAFWAGVRMGGSSHWDPLTARQYA